MHGGDIYSFFQNQNTLHLEHLEHLDYSSNVNTNALPECVKKDIQAFLQGPLVFAYPDNNCTKLKALITKHLCHTPTPYITQKNIALGAGTTALIFDIAKTLKPQKALIIDPAFSEYKKALLQAGTLSKNITSFFALETLNTKALLQTIQKKAPDILFMACPSNPCGAVLKDSQMLQIIKACQKINCFVVLDASFAQYSKKTLCFLDKIYNSSATPPPIYKNLIVLQGFTKFYGLAAFRIGYAIVFNTNIATKLQNNQVFWSINSFAIVAATSILENLCFLTPHYNKYLKDILEQKKRLKKELQALGIKTFDSCGNFILFKTQNTLLKQQLLPYGILIRQCADYTGLDKTYYRIAVRTKNDNDKLVFALCSIYGKKPPQKQSQEKNKTQPHKAKCIMICGTASNVGKSLLCAALCRIFTQDGYKVAPFKSQNMALNSGVTDKSLEIGRAQIVQAECCNKTAQVQMNPILLKCNSDTNTQVIVNGKAKKVLDATQYYKYKKRLLPVVLKAFDTLAKQNDIIVIEGAGSLAEINLKQNDIVNMGLAKALNAPVILVGDIDTGGVFASLYGSVALLPQKEKDLIKGLVINKFRGQKELLKTGIKQIQDLTKKDVLGIVPYIKIDIEAEDSLAVPQYKSAAIDKNKIIACVLRVPHISNFTDFARLASLDAVQLFYVSTFCQYQDLVLQCQKQNTFIDLFILPGSKNTKGDFDFIQKQGFVNEIKTLSSSTIILGLCAGLQMLGSGFLGLLPCSTVFKNKKQLLNTKGTVPLFSGFWSCISGKNFCGYEVHCGKTKGLVKGFSGLAKQNILGVYIHGFLDSPQILGSLIDALLQKKGLPPYYKDHTLPPYKDYKQKQYDILADAVRKSLDIKALYNIINNN